MTIEDRIRARVAAIPEPCAMIMGKSLTLGDMGLIEDVSFTDGHATVTLCLTDPACVHFAAMQHYIADTLRDLPEVTSVGVKQTLYQLWTPDRMVDR